MITETERIDNNIKIIKGKYYPPPFKQQLIELITKFFTFIFKPGAKNEELIRRDFQLNKLKSKRSFITGLISPLTILGIVLVLLVITGAVFAPWIAHYTFEEVTGIDYTILAFSPPDDLHPLGSTYFGRDVFSRLIFGARSSITVGLASIIISVIGGIFFGLVSAFYGGIIDNIIMRISDIFLAFPGIILAIVLVSIYSPSMEVIMMAYSVLGIPGYARLMRSAALQEINKTYVYSAKVSGASNFKVIFRHILPNCIAPIIVSFTFDIGGIILSLAGLSFLGFGDPTLVEWGNDISNARVQIYNAPWAAFYPGLGILITVLGFMLLGDGLRDALDPRIKR